MAAISQTMFSDTFLWMKSLVFWLSIGLNNGLVSNGRQAIIWTNAEPIYWRTYAALGGDVYNKSPLMVAGDLYINYMSEL